MQAFLKVITVSQKCISLVTGLVMAKDRYRSPTHYDKDPQQMSIISWVTFLASSITPNTTQLTILACHPSSQHAL